MAFLEIDEHELANLRGVNAAVLGMLGNKDARQLMLRARKIADPNAEVPEIDVAAPVRAEMAELRQLLVEREAKDAQRDADRVERARVSQFARGWELQKDTLRNQGWQSEGISRVEAFAHERGIADFEAAAALYEKMNPPPLPVQPSGSGSWGFFNAPEDDGKFVKDMLDSRGESEGALDAEIRATLVASRQSSPAGRR